MAIVQYGTRKLEETHERSVEIRIDGARFGVLQASPYDLKELAVGALYCDGTVRDPRGISSIDFDGDRLVVDVRLEAGPGVASRARGRARGSSGGFLPQTLCGDMPGAASAPSSCAEPAPGSVSPDPGTTFDPDDLLCQMEVLCTQATHRNAGECVHGCGVGSPDSRELEFVCEDIGRHNAMDKAIGRALLAGVDLGGRALFITGRISAEMALKAHRAGCPLLVSRKSATDDAIERAGRLGVTLVSHCRDGALRVLTHPGRIRG